ncbi:MAG TPA: transposase [Opitutaceae bacterium]|nr:transposase [Opitutaceae bacterium]
MARKLRLEFPGACYHVINRGNYRADIFRSEGAQAAFESCLFEACAKSGWVLHAFVIMSNHYHLALETPAGNLVAGMQWLQATFANRFNKLRGERGHLFQGRYKALLVEPGGALGQVCDYIHLNPVRAGLVPVERLGEFRHSSYWYLGQPKRRPEFLQVQTALLEAGSLTDTPAGRRSYAAYLAWQAETGPAGKNQAYVSLSQGWALGTQGYKRALIKDHALLAESRAWADEGAQEIRAAVWQEQLARCLRELDKGPADITGGRKSAPWKVAIAAHLKQKSQVTNRWLCEQLQMGTPVSVSQHVGQARRQPGPARQLLKTLNENIKT